MRISDARQSRSLSELVYLCDVPESKVSAIKDLAKNAPIHNEHKGYSCSDYVLELLGILEEEKIIDVEDKEYVKNKKALMGKQEGF